MEGSLLKMSPKSSSGRVQREVRGRGEAIALMKGKCVSVSGEEEVEKTEDSL